MKKSIISIILILSMLFPMASAIGVQAGDVLAVQFTEEDAWRMGAEFYTAWYNHIYKSSNIDNDAGFYKDTISLFKILYNARGADSTEWDKNVNAAYMYLQKLTEFAGSSNAELQLSTFMTLLNTCFLYLNSDDGSEESDADLVDALNAAHKMLNDENIKRYSGAFLEQVGSPKLNSILDTLSSWKVNLNIGNVKFESEIFGDVSKLLQDIKTIADINYSSAKEAASFAGISAIGSDKARFLNSLYSNGSSQTFKDAAAFLYEAYANNSTEHIEETIRGWKAADKAIAKAGSLVKDGLKGCVKLFGSSQLLAGVGGVSSLSVASSTLIAGYTALALVDTIKSYALNPLLGLDKKYSADLLMFNTNIVRQEVYSQYQRDLNAFRNNPTVQTARALNTASQIMYNTLLTENEYAMQCLQTYADAGLLNSATIRNILSGNDTDKTLEVCRVRNTEIINAKKNYYSSAQAAYNTFTITSVKNVSYSLNGGSFAEIDGTDNLTLKYGVVKGDTITVTEATPSRSGYNFLGWASTASAAACEYAPGTELSVNDDLSLYAVWEKQTTPTPDPDPVDPTPDPDPVDPTPDPDPNPDPTPESYTLSGIIRNATEGSADYGKVVEGVTVTRKAADGTVIDTAVTDAEGNFSFTFTGEKGDYIFVLSKAGFQTFTTAAMTIHQTSPSLGAFVIYEEEKSAEIVDEGTCGTNLTWTLDSDGTLTISGEGAMTDYNSSDGAPWYGKRAQIKNVVFGNGITKIGQYAFYDCDSITYIDIPDSVTSIGDYAFRNCDWLDNVNMGANVTSVGDRAFGDCGKLKTVTIPNNLNHSYAVDHSDNLFYGSSITTVIVPKTATSIPDSIRLKPTISAFVAEGNNGFGFFDDDGILYYKDPYYETQKLIKCPQAKNLTDTYTVLDGTNSISSKAFYNMDRVKNIILPDGLTSIGEYAFYDCDLLSTIDIPDSVTSIGDYAFRNCDWLDNVNMGANVTSVGDRAFGDCGKLKTVTIPNNLNHSYAVDHSDNLFYGSSITTVIVPKTATSISPNIHSKPTISAFVAESDNGFGFFDDDGILYYKDPYYETQKLIKCPQAKNLTNTYTVLDGTDSISANAFYNMDKVKNFILPDGLTSIGNYAFYDCDLLATITIPDSVTSIGEYAFSGCDWIDNVVMGANVTSVGRSAFSSCGMLKTVTIPDKLTSGDGVSWSDNYNLFYNTSITTVIVPKTVTTISPNIHSKSTISAFVAEGDNGYGFFDDDGILYYKDPYYETQKLIKCPQAKNLTNTYTVLDGTDSISANAFYNMDKVKNFILPDGLTSIGNYAFYDCDLLATITIPDSVTSIGEYAFSGCDWIDNVVMGANVTSVGRSAFSSCGMLKTVTIPDKLTSGDGVSWSDNYNLFYNTSITTVIVPKTVTTISPNIHSKSTISAFVAEGDNGYGFFDDDGILYYKDPNYETQRLIKCPQSKSIQSYTVLDGTNIISTSAFAANATLKSITIPSSVTSINDNAFSGCPVLSDVTLSDGLATINDYAFQSCTLLKAIHIPASVRAIQSYAFEGCSLLVGAYFYGDTPSSFTANAFQSAKSGFTIYYIDGKSGWTTPTWNGYNTATFVPEQKTPVTGVTLSRATASLTVGDTLTLTATVSPADADDPSVTWSSSAPAVASVAGGVVTAKSAGRATITVTTKDGGFTAKCIVTVTDLVTDPVATITTVPASTKASLGGTVSYSVYISGTFDGFAFYLTAPDGMTVESVVPASPVGGSAISANHMADGRWLVSVMGNCKQTDAPDTLLATITLHVSADAAVGERTLSLEDIAVSDTKGDPVTAVKTVYGTLTVVDYVPGDVNGDGAFDYYDVTKLYACFCGKTTIDNESIKDINGDGTFDYFDVAKLYAVYRGDAVMP